VWLPTVCLLRRLAPCPVSPALCTAAYWAVATNGRPLKPERTKPAFTTALSLRHLPISQSPDAFPRTETSIASTLPPPPSAQRPQLHAMASSLQQMAATITERSKTLINADLKKICKEEGTAQTGNKALLQARVIGRTPTRPLLFTSP